jgi:H+/Cl- antiporter ClcA
MNQSTTKESFLKNTCKWLLLCLLIGLLSGMTSALFLVSLQWVTNYREAHLGLLWCLPIGGLLVGLTYHYLGKEVVRGNNLILEEYEHPKGIIPLKMAPLVFIGTLVTHLVGGSAGREGTAVQMGSAIADQFSKIFHLTIAERRTLLIIGISSGFASVFGTPIAGALFAIEILFFSKVSYRSVLPSFITAYIAYFTVEFLNVPHTHYFIPNIPKINLVNFDWVFPFGIMCGMTAMVFSKTTHFFGMLFTKNIASPMLRPLLGGILLAIVFYATSATKFSGLGVASIIDAFQHPSGHFDFLWKLLFTSLTIGAGFKGGEVTPLFFIGATLGSALSGIIPLPMALLAGMGFVAVFAGATHAPIACTAMGIELFGIECGIYVGLASFIAYLCSGMEGIYGSQIVKGPKYFVYQKLVRTNFKNL